MQNKKEQKSSLKNFLNNNNRTNRAGSSKRRENKTIESLESIMIVQSTQNDLHTKVSEYCYDDTKESKHQLFCEGTQSNKRL